MPRSREQVVWDFVQAWLRKADSDLGAAARLLEEPLKGDDHFNAAFHAQQAAEKYLKAFLVRHQIPFPKTHDLARLLVLVTPVDPELPRELDSAPVLTPFGVEFRYPTEENVSLESARDAFRIAGEVESAVRGRLREYLHKGQPAASASGED